MLEELGAARVLYLCARYLTNWREVWSSFRHGAITPPPVRFRSGLILRGRAQDTPILLFLEVFANQCYRRLSDSRGLVVDVGANIGAFAMDCLYRDRDAVVHAYEPDPETFEMLRQNIKVNGFASRAHLWNEAVGERDGSVSFVRDAISVGSRIGPSSLSVPCVALETVLRRTGRPLVAVLKLDVEGAEAEILEAGRAALPHLRRIIGEYHEQLVPGVRQRLDAVLRTTHACEFVKFRRCSSMFVASALSASAKPELSGARVAGTRRTNTETR